MISIHWFRRDLRLEDNTSLFHALASGVPVQCIFIFDTDILDKLEDKSDKRVLFIHHQLSELNKELRNFNSTLLVYYGKPVEVWKNILSDNKVSEVFINHDYEAYAIRRDKQIADLLQQKNISFHSYKDQVIFEKEEICKPDGSPYLVFTPYMKSWRKNVSQKNFKSFPSEKNLNNLHKKKFQEIISLKKMGFYEIEFDVPDVKPVLRLIKNYHKTRDIPGIKGTSRMSVHLRFGTVSVRELFRKSWLQNDVYSNELIWREFYMMILWNFPDVTTKPFKRKYEFLKWLHDEKDFQRWCDGKTGYPIVDAGMRELNETGFMHNRVRMITSMFLTKYLLIDWRWGEAYFASKLLDYELSSNNGGWQWSAGTGADAAPYFRIFNMDTQVKRFDPNRKYILKWIPEIDTDNYPEPMIDYSFARKRCIEFFKAGLREK